VENLRVFGQNTDLKLKRFAINLYFYPIPRVYQIKKTTLGQNFEKRYPTYCHIDRFDFARDELFYKEEQFSESHRARDVHKIQCALQREHSF
jgi:hypothetical protein